MCLSKLRKGRCTEGPTPSQGPNNGQFIGKLWDMLAHKEDYGDIISWNDDGTMVCIHNVRLLPQVLAQYFRSSRHDSMERQFSHYGFTKIGLQYWHPKFQRDNPSCVWTMRRKKQPGTKCKRQAQAPPARRFQRARKVQGAQTVPKKLTHDETKMLNKKPRTSDQQLCIDNVLRNIKANVEDGTGFIRFNTDVSPVTTSNRDDTLANIYPEAHSNPGDRHVSKREIQSNEISLELNAVFDESSSSTNTHDGKAMMIDGLNILIEDPLDQMVKYGFDEHVHLERGVRYSLNTPMAHSLNFPQMYADYNKAY